MTVLGQGRRSAPVDLTGADGRARSWPTVHALAESLLGPTSGCATSAVHPALHPDRDVLAVTAEVRTGLEGTPTAQVALLGVGAVQLLRPGFRPAWSPDGTRLAHLVEDGVQLEEAHLPLGGSPERLAWSPDGRALLVVVAEPGSELPNLAGSGRLPRPAAQDAWLPHVSSPVQHVAWRRLVVIDVQALRSSVVGRADLNVWDACWAGNSSVVAVCSDGSPTESAWYRADLRRIEVATGADELLVTPSWQLGPLAGSASGRYLAWVEAVCSDRDLSAGSLHLLDLTDRSDQVLPVPADVSAVAFVDDAIGFAGIRGLTTVVGTVSTDGRSEVLWESEDASLLGTQPQAAFQRGRVAFVRNGHRRPPEACLLQAGDLTSLAALPAPAAGAPTWTSQVHRWPAPDGLEIEGWLHLPVTAGPHPLVVIVHGGPVASHRSSWPGSSLVLHALIARGYAVLLPNPRGSSGRGLAFAAAVVGDMGGADARDIEAGVRDLIALGLVDPARVGVTGGSYGGFLSAWFAVRSELFAAAVSQFPVTDWAHQHGASNIPLWDELFLDGRPDAVDGQYRQRSPLTHAAHGRTPTLLLAGERDRACPPGQALAMHRALVAHGIPSECVVYPLEGHGTRDLSATVDATARLLDWFTHWMPAHTETEAV